MVVSEVNIIAETRCCSLSQKLRRLLYTGSVGAADLRVPALLDRQFYQISSPAGRCVFPLRNANVPDFLDEGDWEHITDAKPPA